MCSYIYIYILIIILLYTVLYAKFCIKSSCFYIRTLDKRHCYPIRISSSDNLIADTTEIGTSIRSCETRYGERVHGDDGAIPQAGPYPGFSGVLNAIPRDVNHWWVGQGKDTIEMDSNSDVEDLVEAWGHDKYSRDVT